MLRGAGPAAPKDISASAGVTSPAIWRNLRGPGEQAGKQARWGAGQPQTTAKTEERGALRTPTPNVVWVARDPGKQSAMEQ